MVILKGGCPALNSGKHSQHVFPLALSNPVVRETTFCRLQSYCFLRLHQEATFSCESFGVIYFVPEMGFSAKSLQLQPNTFFSGYDDLNVCIFSL